ncbi:MAG: polysaccharide biosynthesis C-terminal domain-containing protein [Chitinophagales bacterium]
MKRWQFSSVTALQLFQLSRFGGFLLTGILFARMGVEKSSIGRFETFLWLTNLCSFFWITGLMNSLLAIYPKADADDQKRLLSNAFLTISVVSVVIAVSLIVLPVPERPWLYLLFNNPAFIIEFLLFLKGRNNWLIGYGVTTAILQILLCLMPLHLGYSIETAMHGLEFLAFLKFLVAIVLLLQLNGFSPEWRTAVEHFKSAWPLVISFFVNGSAVLIDGTMVQHYFPVEQFAVFQYGSREFPLFTILAAALGTALIPEIARHPATGLQSMKDRTARYMHLFFPVAILLTLFGPAIYTFVFSPAFIESGYIFSALMLLTIPRLFFPHVVLNGLRQNRHIMWISLAEMAVNLLASLLLMHYFGLIGVAYGTIVAFVFEKVILAIVVQRSLQIQPQQYARLPLYAAYSALLLLAYVVSLVLPWHQWLAVSG